MSIIILPVLEKLIGRSPLIISDFQSHSLVVVYVLAFMGFSPPQKMAVSATDTKYYRTANLPPLLHFDLSSAVELGSRL